MLNKYLHRPDDFSDRKDVLFFEEAIKWLDTEYDRVIDLGCGTGNSSTHFKIWNGVTGNLAEMKASPVALKMFHLDMHDLKPLINPYKWDAFIMWDSLEHCVSPFIALDQAKQIIRNGGKGIIFMPGQNWLDHHDHIHCMTVPQMRHLLNRVGLKLISVIEKKYDNPSQYCEGMAIYKVMRDDSFVPKFRL